MRFGKESLFIVGVAVLLTASAASYAGFIDEVTISESAGTGENTAYVVVDFKDGAEYAFEARFDGTTTGDAIHHLLDDETGLEIDFLVYPSGEFVNGLTYDGHSNSEYLGDEDWWHYWISDDGETWTSPGFGISDRIVSDGSWDGWVYGSAGEPIPEPAMLAMLGLGGLLVRRRRA